MDLKESNEEQIKCHSNKAYITCLKEECIYNECRFCQRNTMFVDDNGKCIDFRLTK
jgi:L-lysine 2,3-aminomutase